MGSISVSRGGRRVSDLSPALRGGLPTNSLTFTGATESDPNADNSCCVLLDQFSCSPPHSRSQRRPSQQEFGEVRFVSTAGTLARLMLYVMRVQL